MAFLTACAHDLTSQFKKRIKSRYSVLVVDTTREPWVVVFEGAKADLVRMYNKEWSDDEDDVIDEHSKMITEEAPILAEQ